MAVPRSSNALLSAVRGGNATEVLERLRVRRAEGIEDEQELGMALLAGAERDLRAVCEVLIDAGANVNYADDVGVTPLMMAAESGKVELVQLLRERGADVNRASWFGRTALFYAAASNRLDVGRALLRAGADPLVVDVQGLTAAQVSRTRPITFTIPIWGALVTGDEFRAYGRRPCPACSRTPVEGAVEGPADRVLRGRAGGG